MNSRGRERGSARGQMQKLSAGKFHRGHSLSRQPLFDHLVGAGEQRRRNSKAERFGSLEVEHRFILGRRLHRQISRFLAFENLPM